MGLRGTGHGLSAEDKATAIVVAYLRKRHPIKDELELEERKFDGACYTVFGHYKDDHGNLHQFTVKVDKDGNVVER